jgi:hypothetical protein
MLWEMDLLRPTEIYLTMAYDAILNIRAEGLVRLLRCEMVGP